MGRTSRYGAVVLALLAGFALFCGGWYLSKASSPEPYQVSAARRPAEEEDTSSGSFDTEGTRPDSLLPGETINVNTADLYDLQRLPGIGEKRAQDIITWREEHGPFLSVDGLDQVPGIGPGIIEGLREYTVTGNE